MPWLVRYAVIWPFSGKLLRNGKDYRRKKFIAQILAKFAKYSGKRGQALQAQPVIYLESETEITDISQGLLGGHG
jgi:hypothetical protein